MKNLYVLILMGFLCFYMCQSVYGEGSVTTKNNQVVIDEENMQFVITCLDERTVHIQVCPGNISGFRKSLVVDEKRFQFGDFRVRQEKGKVVVKTSCLEVEYDRTSGQITFIDSNTGKIILAEKSRSFVREEVDGEKGYQITQNFALDPGEAIYGLGQFQDGAFNYRGHQVHLVHANREIANPVLLSTRNYMLYWDNYSKTVFSEQSGVASFFSEVGDGVDYYFIYGRDMNDAVAGFRHLTGEVPMLPKSAFGFWMSKERYRSFDELVGVVAEYRHRNIPLDNIVQDWQYWGEDMGLWNSMSFDTVKFARPKEVIDRLHQQYHVKLTVSVWPGVGKKTKVYQAMDSAGVLFDVPTWAGYKVVDIYSPKAQQLFCHYLNQGLYSKGVDSWWMDATEPSFKDGLYQSRQEYWSKSAGLTAMGSFSRYLNTYSLVLSGMLYDYLRQQSDKRVSILTRSAFAGQQKYGTSTWSGDIYASWDVFRKQIPAGLNLCMTGLPYWTTDIGGFRVISREGRGNQGKGEIGSFQEGNGNSEDGGYRRGLRDSAYLELYTRWFQFGTFCPMFRAHGTEVPREIWNFGEPGSLYYDAQLKMIRLRYSLLSYIYSNAWQVTSSGATMMRPVVMDFTEDEGTFGESGSYMFGESMLVHPVTRPMFYDRKGKIASPDVFVPVYLPRHAGKYWYDFNMDRYYPAGDTLHYEASLNVIPVFVKAGAIIPRDKPAPYANAMDNREMEIVVYAGANARFTLYEDDNETYAYEKGVYRAVDLNWNESRRTLEFSETKGTFKPAFSKQTFQIKVISPDGNGKIKTQSATINYQGRRVKARF